LLKRSNENYSSGLLLSFLGLMSTKKTIFIVQSAHMAKFISISTFASLYDSQSDLLSPEGLDKFIARLNSTEGVDICREKGIERWDLEEFISTLRTPEHLVFYGWISQHKPLENLLTKKSDLTEFQDNAKYLDHQLTEAFKIFVSPYLADAMLRYVGESFDIVSKALSYSGLLDSDHSATVETQLFKGIQDTVKAAKAEAKQFSDEEALVAILQPLCTDEIVHCVNNLSRSMYAARLGYVDDILSFIRYRACTTRLANWILKKMELIQLNSEHKYKINDLRKELSEGALHVRNSGVKGSSPVRWTAGLITLVILAIVGFVIYLVIYQPFSEVNGPEISENTAFQQFSVEERKKIDSLLKEMSSSRSDDDYYDQGIPIMGGNSVMTLRSSFENREMEEIYQDLNKDAILQDQGYIDTCLKAVKYERPAGVGDLEKKKGAVEIMIRNDAEYDVILFVSEPTSYGQVHSLFLRSGEIKVFQMDLDNTLLLVVGNTFQAYNPPNVAADELPSSNYTKHFCDTDYNFGVSINTPYVLVDDNNGKTKFLISGQLGSTVDLVDIYGVLEGM